MSRRPHLQIPGQLPPGMMPQPAVVKVNPCQVYLTDGKRFCFNPEQIKAIREGTGDVPCYLYIAGFPDPVDLACSYDLFLERAGVTPQKIEEPNPSDK